MLFASALAAATSLQSLLKEGKYVLCAGNETQHILPCAHL